MGNDRATTHHTQTDTQPNHFTPAACAHGVTINNQMGMGQGSAAYNIKGSRVSVAVYPSMLRFRQVV